MNKNLNEEQNLAYSTAIYKRLNVFITGAGGTGKSRIIQQIFRDCRGYYNIALTSMTGMSAVLIGGQTVHSYLGIRTGTGSFEKLYDIITKSKKLYYRWKRLEILIIDEISMMSSELFEKLELLGRRIREDDRPFGGIQLIFSGDFLQLKPVKANKFCFESTEWENCFKKENIFYLETILRQDEKDFSDVLSQIRIGQISDTCKKVIENRVKKYDKKDVIPTCLYSINRKVNVVNKKYYDRLNGPEREYKIKFNWKQKIPEYSREKYELSSRFQYNIKLKVGTQIMYLVNKDGLCNGSRGVIKRFIDGYPDIKFKNGIQRVISPESLSVESGDVEIMSYTQLPIKLCWALSIHKSQGMSLDCVKINLKNIFEDGQFYVALSRCRSLDGLYIRNLNWNLVKVNPKALEFYANLKK